MSKNGRSSASALAAKFALLFVCLVLIIFVVIKFTSSSSIPLKMEFSDFGNFLGVLANLLTLLVTIIAVIVALAPIILHFQFESRVESIKKLESDLEDYSHQISFISKLINKHKFIDSVEDVLDVWLKESKQSITFEQYMKEQKKLKALWRNALKEFSLEINQIADDFSFLFDREEKARPFLMMLVILLEYRGKENDKDSKEYKAVAAICKKVDAKIENYIAELKKL